ncbi:MAG: hypothetical protein IBJ07_08640 [Rhizobiaceae bacterium]|nr:hypothetical protein [Rhizobiaceae bacterium]
MAGILAEAAAAGKKSRGASRCLKQSLFEISAGQEKNIPPTLPGTSDRRAAFG